MAVVRYDHTPIYNLPSRIRIQPGKTHQYCFRISIFIECRCRPSECFIGIYRQYYPPSGFDHPGIKKNLCNKVDSGRSVTRWLDYFSFRYHLFNRQFHFIIAQKYEKLSIESSVTGFKLTTS